MIQTVSAVLPETRINTTRSWEKLKQVKYGLGIYPSYKEFSVDEFIAQKKEFRCDVIADVPAGVKYYTLETLPAELKKKYFSTLVRTDCTSLFSYHYESVTKLVLVYIPEQMSCSAPIQLKTCQEKGAGAVHYIIVAGKNSKAVIIDMLEIKNGTYGLSTVHEMYVEEGAEVSYYHLKQMDEGVHHFNTTICAVDEKARVGAVEFLEGGSFVQHSYKTLLNGQLVENNYACAFLVPKNGEYDLFTESVHTKEDTKSMMIVKGLVADKAKVISRSNIKIKREAVRTQSQERADLLLLGESAQGEAVPMLEVENNEVQCSHGSTVSRINDENIFYLQSRGISTKAAQEMLSMAFISKVIDMFPEELQVAISENVEKYISM